MQFLFSNKAKLLPVVQSKLFNKVKKGPSKQLLASEIGRSKALEHYKRKYLLEKYFRKKKNQNLELLNTKVQYLAQEGGGEDNTTYF